MCYSAQIWADYRKYERYGGKLDIKEFATLVGWTRQKGTWTKVVPKALRQAITDHSAGKLYPDTIVEALLAESEGAEAIVAEIDAQVERLEKAEAKLASSKPTKAADNDQRIATRKIAAAQKKLADLETSASADGVDRIWPGYFAPVLVRDPDAGDRKVVPMRYRCRLPGWTEADEVEKPGTYNARRDKLSTVWRKVFGYNHGIMVVDRFYESVFLHNLQQRALAPGEREHNVEVMFTPQKGQELFVACLWTYVEGKGDQPGFYTFAAITDEPPPEILAAGHDRCIVTLDSDDIESWLNPGESTVAALQAILDRGSVVRPHFEHELAA